MRSATNRESVQRKDIAQICGEVDAIGAVGQQTGHAMTQAGLRHIDTRYNY